jgi:rare lipoprotein A
MVSILAPVTLPLLLGACAETELVSHWWKSWGKSDTPTAGSYKIGKTYRVGSQWFTPKENYSYDETGIASWYGPQFHGKRTANGELFDENTLTAAHPTLQIPSLVRVTNLENGRSAVLRVNDRGPFAKGRLIDVSKQAAHVLGFSGAGTARVRVQVLERESRIVADAARKGYPPHIQMAMAYRRNAEPVDNIEVASTSLPPIPAQNSVSTRDIDNLNKQLFRKFPVSQTNIFVQVGSFTDANNARYLRQKLAGMGRVDIYPTQINGQIFNRVRIGPLSSVEQADSILNRAVVAGYGNARIIVD